MTITPEPSGDSTMTGTVADQSALYGLLSRMRDLALVLISVRRLSTTAHLDDFYKTRDNEL
jgi:hypothetical protein